MLRQFTFLLLISAIFITGCGKVPQLARANPQFYEISKETGTASGNLEETITTYRTDLDKAMNMTIGEAGMKLTKGKPESTLGNWLADLMLERARVEDPGKVDFAMQNYGGIRISEIPPGPISRGKIFELMPFDNMLVVLECPGNITAKLLESFARSGGVPVSGNISMLIDGNKASRVKINGKPFDANRTYRIAMPDYIARGGDKSEYLQDLPMLDTGVLIRDAILDAVKNAGEPITVKLDGRISLGKK